MQVRDILTEKMQTVDISASLSKAAEMMRNADIGAMPVTENGEIIGMVTDRDIVIRGIAYGQDPDSTAVRDVMTRDVVTCREDMSVEEAAEVMESSQVRRLLVQNAKGAHIGILGMADLAHAGPARGLTGEVMDQVTRPTPPQESANPNAVPH